MHNLTGCLILAGALALGVTDATAAVGHNDGSSWQPGHNGRSSPLLRIRLRPDNPKSGKERPLQVAGPVSHL